MAEPNTLLDALLAESGMSRQGLARRVNLAGTARGLTLRYDHTSVGRWLHGQVPRAPVGDLICDVLGGQLGRILAIADAGFAMPEMDEVSHASLGQFMGRTTAMWRADNLRRLDLQTSKVARGTAAIAPVWEWSNTPVDSDVSRRGSVVVDSSDVQMMRDARAHYELMYRATGGTTTHSRVAAFLNQNVTPLLHGSHGDALGRELHRAVAGITAIAGISSYDTERQGMAQRYFHQSLRLAKSSGDRAFGAYVLALLVNQALALGDARQAIALAESALRSADRSLSPALAADLRSMQAKAFAQVGDRSGAYSSIRLAEAAASNLGRDEEPAETGYVELGLIESQIAEALIDLNDLAPADRYAQSSVARETHPRGQVNRLATIATIALRNGEAEKAAMYAMVMAGRAQGMESHRLAGRFRKLRRGLSACPSAQVHAAVERIDRSLVVLD